MSIRHPLAARARERGAVLIVALLFMLVIMILGLAGSSQSLTQLHLAGNNASYMTDMQVAEGSLRQAYTAMLQGGFSSQTFTLSGNNGYYQFNASQTPLWQQNLGSSAFWSNTSKAVSGYQGSSYVVEKLPAVALPGVSSGNRQQYGQAAGGTTYRVTTRAVSGNGSNPVVLQAIFSQ
ncbi:hypothetical protein CEK28_13730 [Xenophilus sp. AP218F]|nr:PilX N-terminal domain-containing pilus assembly protein [Chromobacterium sp. ASV5]OWY38321.1 hypothetical protein CEK28_13730 [Xenophilus sp. AP218F]